MKIRVSIWQSSDKQQYFFKRDIELFIYLFDQLFQEVTKVLMLWIFLKNWEIVVCLFPQNLTIDDSVDDDYLSLTISDVRHFIFQLLLLVRL